MAGKIVMVMTRDKATKNTIRYGDGNGHNIYLSNAEVAELGDPEALTVTVEKQEL